MKRYRTEPIFIGQLRSDGERVIEPSTADWLYDDNYEVRPLSISKGTYLAFSGATYIVKLKNSPNANK